jgi:hypothetical protein
MRQPAPTVTAPTPIPRHGSGPVEPWTPPLDHEALQTLLAKFRQWDPFDADALLEDIGEVLDDVAPPADGLDELTGRLHGHLIRLATIGTATKADQQDAQAHRLIGQARELREADVPGGYRQALGHLRRMAWTANELAERLAALKCLKEVAL